MKVSGLRLCRWSAVLGLAAVLLTSQVALAARVAVSSLEGDPKGKLRAQVTAALRKTRKVQVSPPTAWTQAAGKQGLKGPAAVTPAAVKRLAPKLRVDAVLTGSAGRDFDVRLMNQDGQVVWSESYPLKRGLLAPKDAARLAQAVATARTTAPESPAPAQASPPPLPPLPPPPSRAEPQARAEPSEAPREVPPEPPAKATAPAPVVKKDAPVRAPAAPRAPAPGKAGRSAALAWVELDDESHTFVAGSGGGVADEEQVKDVPARPGAHPPRVRVQVGAAVTWRSYCARPGVESCAVFDARPPEQRLGDTADYSAQAPYAGVAAEAEVFPLTHRTSLLRGLGLTLAYQRSFAPTTVVVTTPTGSTPQREVTATDTAYGAMLAWRYFFAREGSDAPLWGYAGVRLGVLGREFGLDETLNVALPLVHRFSPAVGVDVSVPLLRLVRVEAAGRFFFLPSPGHSLSGGGDDGPYPSEVRDYGTAVSSLGWSAEVGVAGDVWGPFGYSVRGHVEGYRDGFTGQGTRRGWTEGGVAQETYLSVLAGVTASW
ncbi:hypothetical protein [Cystobacter fuscus]|uniref:hypothetical protein n=1 Tax=Cystobacter fuscus TaxID=43 RepID=UPI0007C56239|nr:hypothetical protein [Cystobacter fuscus]